jgi:peptide methionine sulfoxide reductase msrA/msrB
MHNPLAKQEKEIIINKKTEPPFSGEYDDFFVDGIYLCKNCSTPLFSSKDKFNSQCGWPSFDDELNNSIKRIPDADGHRTEIVCANCNAHLGHVFEGENLTDKNTRHCVNSLSLKFIPQDNENKQETIYLGGGCFWCIEAVFQKIKGVTEAISGYSGGFVNNPRYKEVCSGETGHAEVVKITFDKSTINLETLLEIFFEVHDPTSLNKQGADVGTQYRSIILYASLRHKEIIEEFIDDQNRSDKLKDKIVTEVEPLIKFFEAEDYHKDYYLNNPNNSYCAIVIEPKLKKFFKEFSGLAKN